jgi:DNA-binding MarR family transcriptional regulator
MSKQHYQVSTYKARSSIGYLVKRSHSLWLDIMEPLLEAHGFSFVQYVILAWLREGIAVNPRDFCAQFRHDSGAMTRVVDQLCERGLLERARRGVDRRKVELQLTPAGLDAVEKLIPLVVEKLNVVLGDFSTDEFEELQRLMIKMNSKLQATLETGAAHTGAAHTGSAHTGSAHTGPTLPAAGRAATELSAET